MHTKRWITALVAVPILIFLIGPGPGWLLHALLCAIALLALNEFYRMIRPRVTPVVRIISMFLTAVLFLSLSMRWIILVPGIFAFYAFLPLLQSLFYDMPPDEKHTATVACAILGPVYICIPLALLVLIDIQPFGHMWIFFLLVVVFATDTGAFYTGRTWGKHKLYKSVSPNKTWEGTVGGFFTGTAAGVLFAAYTGIHPINAALFIVAALVGTAGQLGDLIESMLKRNHGVKDSGNLLPGHGGMLDRMDSILGAAPVLYLYLTLFTL
ncbi:MAG: phosphatidate cytidylyltransferase [Desulfatiglandaceae bacterium]